MTTDEIKTLAARTLRLLHGDYQRGGGEASSLEGCSSEVLVLAGAERGALAELRLGPESLVLAPAGSVPAVARAHVIPYTGDLTGEEQELVFDSGLVVGRESYTTAPFMPLTRLTAVAICDGEDLENFLADADAAALEGSFEPHLLHPLLMLADACALGACDCAAPLRARAVVGPDGVRPSLGGAPFSSTDPQGPGCTICLAGVVAPELLRAGRLARPWLARYLLVLGVLRALRRRLPGEVEVSGFGRRLNPSIAPEPLEDLHAPVLLRAGDQYLACDPVSRRVLRTGRDAARVMEVALAAGGGDLVDGVAVHLGLRTPAAREVVDALLAAFNGIGFEPALAR
jgi:hypothetical protein